MFALDPLSGAIVPRVSVLADAVEALGLVAATMVRRLGYPDPPWQIIAGWTRGRLLFGPLKTRPMSLAPLCQRGRAPPCPLCDTATTTATLPPTTKPRRSPSPSAWPSSSPHAAVNISHKPGRTVIFQVIRVTERASIS
ncbi:hypothetical protein [Georgenia sp.]